MEWNKEVSNELKVAILNEELVTIEKITNNFPTDVIELSITDGDDWFSPLEFSLINKKLKSFDKLLSVLWDEKNINLIFQNARPRDIDSIFEAFIKYFKFNDEQYKEEVSTILSKYFTIRYQEKLKTNFQLRTLFKDIFEANSIEEKKKIYIESFLGKIPAIDVFKKISSYPGTNVLIFDEKVSKTIALDELIDKNYQLGDSHLDKAKELKKEIKALLKEKIQPTNEELVAFLSFKDDKEISKLLLKTGLNPNAYERHGHTFLIRYISILPIEIISEYVKAGAWLVMPESNEWCYETSTNNSPFIALIHDNDLEKVRFLLENFKKQIPLQYEKEVEINGIKKNVKIGGPLHYAVNRKKTEMVNLLLEFGADPNAYDELTLLNNDECLIVKDSVLTKTEF
jgi:hypothetical protein